MIKLGTTFTKTYVVMTTEGNPLQEFEDYRIERVNKNIDIGLSECEYQRQSGRTTKMIIGAIEHLINNPSDNVGIFVHNKSMQKIIRTKLEHYLSQYCWAPNIFTVSKRVFVAVDEKDLKGIDIHLTLIDNCISDIERKDWIKRLEK
jgi:hypothetical protein